MTVTVTGTNEAPTITGGVADAALLEQPGVTDAVSLDSTGGTINGMIRGVDQVLELARIDAGRFELQLGAVELPEVAGRAERVFAPLAREKGLLFRVELGDEVPEVIFTDRQRLDQILTNLLGNAIKFTDRGEVALRIHREGPRVAFAVSDTGVGVAAADRARVARAHWNLRDRSTT